MEKVRYSKMSPQKRRFRREEFVNEQGGLCFWCKLPLTGPPREKPKINWSLFPKDFLKYPVHLQHCHKTDKVEGAVHAYCNAIMWQYHAR